MLKVFQKVVSIKNVLLFYKSVLKSYNKKLPINSNKNFSEHFSHTHTQTLTTSVFIAIITC